MARYPTFEEYAKRNAFAEGIKRCDELLVKSPKDSQLLITKLQLISASSPESEDGPKLLEQLSSIEPRLDINDVVLVETAVVETFKNIHPVPQSAGPGVSRLWESSFKASKHDSHKLDLLHVRFSQAVTQNRLQDAQQALIQLKAFQPKNRSFYMAHAAYTQLLSSSKEDLQSRLALSLARKAFNDKFDEDKSLDCRVAGQIFAIQSSKKDLENVRERPAFRESKQVYEALKLHHKHLANGNSLTPATAKDPEKTSPREWLESEVELLKGNLANLVRGNASKGILEQFVANSLRLLHTATHSLRLGARTRVAADPCFLAVSGLVKLFTTTEDETYLLQAAYVTSWLLKFDQHVHEARLVLIHISMRLGLGKQAMAMFDTLSVKEIQHDTVGHVLFTRLSTTHPFKWKLPIEGWFDPHERTNKALQIYPRHEEKLSQAEWGVLEHGQSGMIFDLNQLRKDLRLSWSRRMILLEHRRLARLAGKGYGKGSSEVGPRLTVNWTETNDNRDFNAAFNHGFNVEEALHSKEKSIPKTAWLLYSLAADTAWSIAGKQMALVLDLDKLIIAVAEVAWNGNGELSGAELMASRVLVATLPVLETVKASSSPSKDSIVALQSALEQLPIVALTKTRDSLTEHLHDHFVYIDTLLIVHRTCKYIKDTAEHIPQEVVSLQNSTLALIRQIQTHATEQSSRLQKSDVLNRLVREGTLRDSISSLAGPIFLEGWSMDIVTGAKEGWESVSKVTLPS